MSGERQDNATAVQKEAASLVEDGDAGSNAVISGGKPTRLDSETAHRITAAIARDQDRGHVRPMAEYVREANRRR